LIFEQKTTVTEQLKHKFTDKKGRWSGSKTIKNEVKKEENQQKQIKREVYIQKKA
jgi:hypothetical protein